ncbi:UNVERIFIED_CONTAM: hypothetical protein Sindi_0508900 [Sesamum indicum]
MFDAIPSPRVETWWVYCYPKLEAEESSSHCDPNRHINEGATRQKSSGWLEHRGTMSSINSSFSFSISTTSPLHEEQPEGPSGARSRSRSRSNPSNNSSDDETPRHVRFQQALDNSAWIGIVSKVKQSISQIKEKYFIPHDFEVLIPRSFDRMHTPPRGFCTLSIGYFEAGLRLPLAAPVACILMDLRLNPMQLSPNSISHIVLFVIIMRALHLDPSFDNFWSLYSFTTSTRSANRGFFYLTFRRQCRYLELLKSNIGPWKDRFLFVRPPPGQKWPFTLKWSVDKPEPVTKGESLDGDLINSLTSNPFFPKNLLTEEVFCLERLSWASVPITGSLETKIMQARMIQRAQAHEERAARERALQQSTLTPDRDPHRSTPLRPEPDTSATLTVEMQRPDTPIEVGSEETHPQNSTTSSECFPSTEMVDSQAGGDAAGPNRHRKRKHISPSKSRHGRLHFHGRTEEDEAAARAREDQNLHHLREIADWEQSAQANHRTES